jgi:hypothetical protein
MSTRLIDEENGFGFYLTRFYGGEEKGECYQITGPSENNSNGYVQLTREQAVQLTSALIRDLLRNEES